MLGLNAVEILAELAAELPLVSGEKIEKFTQLMTGAIRNTITVLVSQTRDALRAKKKRVEEKKTNCNTIFRLETSTSSYNRRGSLAPATSLRAALLTHAASIALQSEPCCCADRKQRGWLHDSPHRSLLALEAQLGPRVRQRGQHHGALAPKSDRTSTTCA